MPKETFTCRKIASFMNDEFHANLTYGKLATFAQNAPKKNALIHANSSAIHAKLTDMSGDEHEHYGFLTEMAKMLKCDEKPWFNKAVAKLSK